MKSSESLRRMLAQVRADPRPLSHRTYPKGSGPGGITKAEVIAGIERDIAYFKEQEEEQERALRENPVTRVAIRKVDDYRGETGYLVTASRKHGNPAQFFVLRKKSADEIKKAIARGGDIRDVQEAIDQIIRSERRHR